MALAKYFEDNYEMVIERLDALEEKRRNSEQPLPMFETKSWLNYITSAKEVKVFKAGCSYMPSGEWRTCICCGRIFYFSEGEKRYFKEHGLCMPKRCKACRKLRKEHPGNER